MSREKPLAPQETPPRYRAVLLLGPPGSGKGTQGATLGHVPGFFHFAMGDALRKVDSQSELGQTFRSYSTRGELVPDESIVHFWATTMQACVTLSHFRPHTELLILDGIPRTAAQAKLLETHIDVQKVINLTCPDVNLLVERLMKRALKEKRADDANEQVIRRRMEVYEQDTRKILDVYPAKLIGEVPAVGSPARILLGILGHLAPLQELHFTGSL